MINDLEQAIKLEMKELRLKNLQTTWYDLYLTKVAAEALGKTKDLEIINARMNELEVSYNTIAAMEVEG